ncbi:MAG: hypothetical protein O2919_07130, partial [Chloroflexi bacterium]|nr:hypothetical protein [Chloroflexota bacterium]
LAEALAAGHAFPDALERSRPAEAGALALVEHPELASIAGADGGSTTQRLLVRIVGPGFRLISSPSRRDDGLRALRDRFASETETVTGRLRVAVMYGGVEPAGEAMATWIRRHRPEADVHAAAITRHQGTRLGPGFVGLAWVVEASGG